MTKEIISSLFKLNELLHINWNRLSELTGIRNRSEKEKGETSCRTSIQNKFSCGKEGDEKNNEEVRQLILWLNKETNINPKKYLPKQKSRREIQ